MVCPKVFADFHNADSNGRVRLNCIGTIQDLNEQKLVLEEGMTLTLYSESLQVLGRAEHSADEGIWVAAIDWQAIKDTDILTEAVRPEVPKRQSA